MTPGRALGKKERAGIVALLAAMPVIYAALAILVWRPSVADAAIQLVMWTVGLVGGVCGVHLMQHGATDRALITKGAQPQAVAKSGDEGGAA